MRSRGWYLLAVSSLALLAACKGDDPKPAPPAPAPTQAPAPPVATAATTAASVAVTASAAAPAPSASASAAPADIVRSARPTPLEWCKGETALLGPAGMFGGSETYACGMTVVREWVLVECPLSGAREEKNLGKYDRAVPGGGSMANADEVAVGRVESAQDGVVISLRPGTVAKPIFYYRPFDHPEWTREETFSFELPADAKGLQDRRLNGGPWPSMANPDVHRCEELDEKRKAEAERVAKEKADKSAADDAKGQPDVEGMPPVPADDAWAAEKEVTVTGSGALGCHTKVKDRWFWMRCEGKEKFSAVEVERGKRPTQTNASVEASVAKLVTPYVEETDLRARLALEGGGERFLMLRWPKGKQPVQVGAVVDKR